MLLSPFSSKRCPGPLTVLGFILAFSLAASASSLEPILFSGLGSYKRKVSTDSPEAQKWFNQGLNWYYAFNFDEAQLAFRKATELDPECAMAWWGLSEAAGPQYNHPVMDEKRTALAREAMTKAFKHRQSASPVERALIETLEHRNALESPDMEKQTEQNKRYAEALGNVWEAHPNDPDVGALYANARMVVRPWMLYDVSTRRPTGDTHEIRAVVEQILAVAPYHPGALHLYIHVIEPSTDPKLALSVADRLSDLVPAAGHLIHMPSHIYIQTGHWDRAITQNARAIGADVAYRSRAPGRLGQIGYHIHNAHMLAFAAMMSARKNEAMDAARAMWSMWERLPTDAREEDLKREAGWIDTLMCTVYDVHKRFGDWDGILAEPEPPGAEHFPITCALRHAARAIAHANQGQIDAAQAELRFFREKKEALGEERLFGGDKAQLVLDVSLHFAEGEIALNQQEWTEAAAHLEKAIEIEDLLGYAEPPQYLQPTRHALGAVYLASGNAAKAARVYRRDLKEWQDNVWSLHGLQRALEAQGKASAAARAARRFARAMEYADFPVDSSCLCLRPE